MPPLLKPPKLPKIFRKPGTPPKDAPKGVPVPDLKDVKRKIATDREKRRKRVLTWVDAMDCVNAVLQPTAMARRMGRLAKMLTSNPLETGELDAAEIDECMEKKLLGQSKPRATKDGKHRTRKP